ncbi:MAG: hypothetical protein VB144_04980 [Clostridia bacterium]|nr:hypothetical protein [Clostridia bacterium]
MLWQTKECRPDETIYMLVRGYSSSHKPDTPYTLRAEFREARDVFEPNDSIQQTSTVVSGRQFDSFIYRPGDVDFYRIDVSWPSTIKVTSTQPADYHLSIVDSSGAKQLYGGNLGTPGQDMFLEGDVYESGAYYVLMRGYSSSAYNMHTPYNMKIQVKLALHDSAEPNDSASQARGLQLGQPVTGVIPTDTDQDWWYFDTPLLGKVRITCAQPADFRLRVVDSTGKEIAYSGPRNLDTAARRNTIDCAHEKELHTVIQGQSRNGASQGG